MVDISRVKSGIIRYSEASIYPKMVGVKQFLAGTAIGIVINRLDEIIISNANNPIVKSAKIIDGQKIDIDVIYHAAKEQFARQRDVVLMVPFIGEMTFHESDLDALYQSICTQ